MSWFRFTGLQQYPTALWAEFAGALDQPVGAFDRLDRDDLTLFDSQRLADVQRRDLL